MRCPRFASWAAGSLEFLFLGLVLAAAPLASVVVTAFLVNFWHVFYALSSPCIASGDASARRTASSP